MRYLVILKPLSPFFFGSEHTFGPLDNQNYLVKSNRYPQQTALLGMMRRELLLASDCLNVKDRTITNMDKAIETVGNKSFDMNDSFDDMGNITTIPDDRYGIIKNLSPIFIIKPPPLDKASSIEEYRYYYTTPFNTGFSLETIQGVVSGARCENKELIPYLINTEDSKQSIGKTSLIDCLRSFIDGIDVDIKEVFQKVEQVGNRKSDRDDQEDGFYKQTFFRFKEDYAFAFFLELWENPDKFQNNIVFLGAERSAFSMTLIKTDTGLDNIITGKHESTEQYPRLIAVSDMYIPRNAYEEAFFAITKTIDFRNVTNWISKEYSFKKSAKKYTLVTRGSVFYFKEKVQMAEFEKKITIPNLQTIGYNKFITII